MCIHDPARHLHALYRCLEHGQVALVRVIIASVWRAWREVHLACIRVFAYWVF